MRSTRVLLAVAAAIALAGCHDATEVTASPARPLDALTYSGYDASGREVVTGWIEIVYPDLVEPKTSSGIWNLRALVDPRRAGLGPQVGTGTLEVTFGAPTVVDLNPGDPRGHVVLAGTLTVAPGPRVVSFEGTWSYVTAAGVRNQGTFRAE